MEPKTYLKLVILFSVALIFIVFFAGLADLEIARLWGIGWLIFELFGAITKKLMPFAELRETLTVPLTSWHISKSHFVMSWMLGKVKPSFLLDLLAKTNGIKQRIEQSQKQLKLTLFCFFFSVFRILQFKFCHAAFGFRIGLKVRQPMD